MGITVHNKSKGRDTSNYATRSTRVCKQMYTETWTAYGRACRDKFRGNPERPERKTNSVITQALPTVFQCLFVLVSP
jgi:hypothetical protein